MKNTIKTLAIVLVALTIVFTACDITDGNEEKDEPIQGPTTLSSIPDELIGEWYKGEILAFEITSAGKLIMADVTYDISVSISGSDKTVTLKFGDASVGTFNYAINSNQMLLFTGTGSGQTIANLLSVVKLSRITYTAVQYGGVNSQITSTGISFTFSESIDSLNLTAADITLSGTASKNDTGTQLIKEGAAWILAPITVNAAGLATVSITKNRIEKTVKSVPVHKEGQTTPIYCSITWDLNDGTISDGTQSQYLTVILSGTVLYQPSPPPTKAGSTFGGWYRDSNLTQLYNFVYPVTSDLTLYAKWTTNLSITWVLNGGTGGGPYPTQIQSGTVLTQPSSPTKSGSTFGGWYSNSNLTQQYNFAYAVTSNLTLYAKWSQGNGGGPNTPVDPDTGNITATGVSLNQTNITIAVGYTATLTATVSPPNATNKEVFWSIGNNNIIVLNYYNSSSATISGVATGATTVTVTTANGKTATCSVTVVVGADETVPTNPIPNAPSGIYAEVYTDYIHITWNGVYNCYHLYRSDSYDGYYSLIDSVYDNWYNDFNVSSGTTYYYKVSAFNNYGESSYSSVVSATAVTSPPDWTE